MRLSPFPKSTLLPMMICSLVFCASPSFADQKDVEAEPSLKIFGETEYLFIQEAKLHYDSRIDTGATTCSIHAVDIEPFERDGDAWVKFNLVDVKKKQNIAVEKPVARVVSIKRHGAESQERYVVLLGVKLGDDVVKTEFSLTDRSDYTYPLLVGRNLLRGVATVDVSKSYVLGKAGRN